MKTIFALVITVVGSFVGHGQTAKPSIENLAWLAGCWQVKDSKPGTTISEQWMLPAGNAMLGAGRTVKNGKMTEFEFLRIVQSDSGLAYIARPAENPVDTSFSLISWANDEYVFENKEHDFPQRVIYRRENDGSLFARVEGMDKGRSLGFDFLSTRSKCEK